MRRKYKYLYHAAPIPIVRAIGNYDPVRTYVERCATASHLTKRRAKIGITKTIELWIELIVPSLLTLVMLPALWGVGVIMLASALWRRYVQDRGRRRTSNDRSYSYARRPVWSSRIARTCRAGQHRARRIRGCRSWSRTRVLSPRSRTRPIHHPTLSAPRHSSS